ncbi:MAG: phage protease [Phycisphaerae bacterium]
MQTRTERTAGIDDRNVDKVVLETPAFGRGSSDEDAHVPDRILIVPAGEVRTASGAFLVDDEAMAAAVAAFERHGTDLPIDYEHQTLGGPYSSPTGQAPAAGWITALRQVRPGDEATDDRGEPLEPGLWADVSWTAEAREKLASKQYRYISPVALVRRADRRLVGIHSVALTNKPAIVGIRPVVNGQSAAAAPPAEDPSPGVPEGFTLTALREVLAVDDTAEDSVVVAAAVERIHTLARAEASRQASERVAAAVTTGKLTAAQREWALSLARRDPDEFDRWLATAPVVVVPGRTIPPNEPSAPGAARRAAVASAARAEWHANRAFLDKLCTEDAYVADALRDADA